MDACGRIRRATIGLNTGIVLVLGGRYREQQKAQCVEDLTLAWLASRGGTNPFLSDEERALNSADYSDEDTLLQRNLDSRIAADVGAYLPQYVLSHCPLDFRRVDVALSAWDVPNDLHLHHILPLGSAVTLQESAKELRANRDHVLNSPLNLTYVLSSTNLELRALPAATYMSEVPDAARAAHFLPVDESVYHTIGDEAPINSIAESFRTGTRHCGCWFHRN